jgi:hypothetical protein
MTQISSFKENKEVAVQWGRQIMCVHRTRQRVLLAYFTVPWEQVSLEDLKQRGKGKNYDQRMLGRDNTKSNLKAWAGIRK